MSLEEVELGLELGFGDENGCLLLFSGMYTLKVGSLVLLEPLLEIQKWWLFNESLGGSATCHSLWVWCKLGCCCPYEKFEVDEEGDTEDNVMVLSEG